MCLWGYCSWRWDPVPTIFYFIFLHKGCFLQQRPQMTWISMDTWFSKRFRCVFFRILIWIQLPEGRLAGVTWMWHTDPRWSGIASCLLEWHCHFTNVLGHQLLYRLIMHNTRGCIWPPNSTDNELFKGHLRKYINIARQLMQWEIDTMCSKDVRSYICIWITNTFATWGYLGNLLEEMTSIITHECFYDHYAYQIIFAVWSRETPSSAANTCIFIY